MNFTEMDLSVNAEAGNGMECGGYLSFTAEAFSFNHRFQTGFVGSLASIQREERATFWG
jgi:hypothetical protein